MLETTPVATEGLLLSLRQLSDDTLVARLKGLAACERRATALLIAHLAEMDTRDVYLRAGYSSLFAYCCGVLALSEHEALNRIEAARAARRFPGVLRLLEAGEINLTAIRLLGPHLTPENHAAVLESARGKRKVEVEVIVAALSPRADVSASVRKLPEPQTRRPLIGLAERSVQKVPPPEAAVPAPVGSHSAGGPSGSCSEDPCEDRSGDARAFAADGTRVVVDATQNPRLAAILIASPRRSAEISPLSPDRYRYQLTISGATLEKLRFAKDMLRHALPSGDDEAILDRALTSLLTDLARTKFGGEGRTKSSQMSKDPFPGETVPSPKEAGGGGRGTPEPRHIPTSVRRAVWVRDLGRCAFVSADGHPCGERAFVEFHHVQPCAAGGKPTVANIQLRCRRHNGYEARVFFDRETVDAGSDGRADTSTVGGRSGTSSGWWNVGQARSANARLGPLASR